MLLGYIFLSLLDSTMRGKKWRFLNTGKGNAVFNMALDEAMLRLAELPDSSPVFRVYGWEPPAITLGYSQDACVIIDCERCRADGIDVVVRPTGGRAVYHEQEIAYAIIAPIGDSHFGGSVMETYSRISSLLCNALGRLGVQAVFKRGSIEHERYHFANNAPCFLSVSRYEITCDGKKIIGSAQRRFKRAFLQHGSILTGPGQGEIARYSLNQKYPVRLADAIERRCGNLRSILGESFNTEAIVEALFEELRATVKTDVVRSEPLDEEITLAEDLIRQSADEENPLKRIRSGINHSC